MKRAKNHIYLVLKSSLHLCKLLVFQNSLIITNLPEVVIFGYFHDFPVPIVQYAPYDECIPMPPIPKLYGGVRCLCYLFLVIRTVRYTRT